MPPTNASQDAPLEQTQARSFRGYFQSVKLLALTATLCSSGLHGHDRAPAQSATSAVTSQILRDVFGLSAGKASLSSLLASGLPMEMTKPSIGRSEKP